MVFHRSLSDSKSPQVSRTLLSILVDLNNSVVSMVSTRSLISTSSNPLTSPLTSPLVTVPSGLITIGITVTFMFQNFFSSLARSRYLSLFRFPSVLLCGQPERQTSQFGRFSFFSFFFLLFLLTITRSGRLTGIRWFLCISKSQRI